MAIKALFSIDDIFNDLIPFYGKALQSGDLEVFGLSELDNDNVTIYPLRKRGGWKER